MWQIVQEEYYAVRATSASMKRNSQRDMYIQKGISDLGIKHAGWLFMVYKNKTNQQQVTTVVTSCAVSLRLNAKPLKVN